MLSDLKVALHFTWSCFLLRNLFFFRDNITDITLEFYENIPVTLWFLLYPLFIVVTIRNKTAIVFKFQYKYIYR